MKKIIALFLLISTVAFAGGIPGKMMNFSEGISIPGDGAVQVGGGKKAKQYTIYTEGLLDYWIPQDYNAASYKWPSHLGAMTLVASASTPASAPTVILDGVTLGNSAVVFNGKQELYALGAPSVSGNTMIVVADSTYAGNFPSYNCMFGLGNIPAIHGKINTKEIFPNATFYVNGSLSAAIPNLLNKFWVAQARTSSMSGVHIGRMPQGIYPERTWSGKIYFIALYSGSVASLAEQLKPMMKANWGIE